MAAAQHGKGSRGGAIDAHALHLRRRLADQPRGLCGFVAVLAGNDDRGEPAEGRGVGAAAVFGLDQIEALAVAGDQRLDHLRIGHAGLDEDMARLFAAPGAPGDLHDLLEGAFGRAQVAALQPQVRIDHADQGQVREMIALGDELGADDDVDVPSLDRLHEIGGAGGRVQRVGRGDGHPRLWPECLHLVGDALDAGAAGNQAVLFLALGAEARRRDDMAAMMAGQPLGQPMLDHPAGAIGALEAIAAMAAKRQRRIAAPVEEEQALLALGQHFLHRHHQRRRDPAAALGRIGQQVDALDIGHLRAAETGRQLDLAIAAKVDLMPCLDRRGGGGQNDREMFDKAPHHRDVAGMIMDAFLLLEARLMRLVDDDEAEIGIGQEQGGAGTDDDPRLTRRDRTPGAAPFALAQAAVPVNRNGTETFLEPLQKGFCQGDFRQQHQGLLAGADGRGDRLEIDLGLARSGDAVEQEGGEFMGTHRVRHVGRGRHLLIGQGRRRVGWVGLREGGVYADLDRIERAGLHQPADHRIADPADHRQFAHQPLPVADPLHRLGPLFGHAIGQLAGGTIFDDGARALQRGHRRQRHAQHGGRRGEIIVGGPFDQPAQRFGQRRRVQHFQQVAQPVVADRLDIREGVFVPHHADQLARAQRRDHDAAGPGRHAMGDAIVERAEGGIEQEDTGAGHAASLTALAVLANRQSRQAIASQGTWTTSLGRSSGKLCWRI